jgi:DNA-binding CsgD family transcriptional regulator
MKEGTRAGKGARGVLVLAREHSMRRVLPEILAARFQLTKSEIDLALAISAGVRAAEYASRRGVSLSTVRSHLRSLLGKTGARTQGDVISLVARLRPVLSLPAGQP